MGKLINLILVLLNVSNLIAQDYQIILPFGHLSNVNSAEFSPDGKKIVTSSNDVTAKLWDAYTGLLLYDLKGHTTNVISAKFSPDGSKIVTLSYNFDAKKWDSTLIIWSASTGELLINIPGLSGHVNSVQFSPDGNKLITGSVDNIARVWDVNTGALLQDFKGHSGWVNSAYFSPDGNKIVTASKDKSAKIWDANTGIILFNLVGHWNSVASAQFSPDGRKIITISDDHTAKIWNAVTGTLIADLKRHKGVVQSSQFSPDGKKILTVSVDKTVIAWDAESGKQLIELKTETNKALFSLDGKTIVTDAAIWDIRTGALILSIRPKSYLSSLSNDGKKILSVLGNTVKVFNSVTGALLAELRGHTSTVYSAQFSPDGKKIVFSSGDTTAKIWDTNTGELLGLLKGHSSAVASAKFSPDSKKIVTIGWFPDSIVKIWDAETIELLVDLKGHKGSVTSAQFSPDGKKILTLGDLTSKNWDTQTGALIGDIKLQNPYERGRNRPCGLGYVEQISPDGKRILTNYRTLYEDFTFFKGGEIIIDIFDVETGKILLQLGHTTLVSSAQFSPDGQKIITSGGQTVKIWNANTGKLLFDLIGHTRFVCSAQFSPDGKKIITASGDNTAKVWDVNTGLILYTFFAVDSTDYFYQIPSGYYMCTPNAAKQLHYVTKDLKVITFEQLDVKYNRPDMVLQTIGCTDTSLIESYRKAYYKRIEKLGFDTSFFKGGINVPEADFENRNEIPAEENSGKLRLHIKAIDKIYKLDRFNLWINEVPLFGKRGISLKPRDSKEFDTTLTISLSSNENRIETSVTNVSGLESYRKPLHVVYSPKQPVSEKIYFFGIGINNFADKWYNLEYSIKDIQDLSVKLKKKFKDNIQIDTLFDDNVTVTNVKALKQKLLKTMEDDKVILAYSGHGFLSKDYDYYLSTYNLNFKNPEDNGLSYYELEGLLDSIPARKKLMLIDACHSGEVDKEEMSKMVRVQRELDSTIKGITYYFDSTKKMVGMKNSFALMQDLFVNVGKSTGATIISAASGTQFALERGDLKNGVFTFSILEAMEKYTTLKVSELKRIVGYRVEQLTKGMQKPTFRNQTIYFDWDVW